MTGSEQPILVDTESSDTIDTECCNGVYKNSIEQKFETKKEHNLNIPGLIICILLCGILLALQCLTVSWWIDYKAARAASEVPYSIDVGIDAARLGLCADGSHHGDSLDSYAESCAIVYGNGSIAMLSGLGQPIAPLKQLTVAVGPKAAASAVVPVRLQQPVGSSELTVAQPGLYQLDTQVTFVEPNYGDNVGVYLSINGRCVAQCNMYCAIDLQPASSSQLSCPISIIRRLNAGSKISIKADPLLRVATNPAQTYLRVSRLPLNTVEF